MKKIIVFGMGTGSNALDEYLFNMQRQLAEQVHFIFFVESGSDPHRQ